MEVINSLGRLAIIGDGLAGDTLDELSDAVPIHQESVGGHHPFGGRFRPLRNRPPVFWCHFLESWRQDGENREKTRKNGAKMGEIWPKKKSAGRRSIIEVSVPPVAEADVPKVAETRSLPCVPNPRS